MSDSNKRKISRMEISEAGEEIGSTVKTGFFVTKKVVIIVSSVYALLLVGVILATHFGTKATLSTTTTATKTTTKAPATTKNPPDTTKIPEPLDYRLPTDCMPFFYHLEVKPYIGPEEVYGSKAFTHEGKMTIHLNCTKPTKQLKFHALNLRIDGSTIEMRADDGQALGFNKKISYDTEREYYTIDFDSEIQPNSNRDNYYILTIPFSGDIITQLYGFYRNSYIENGVTYHLASTKFEPTYARRAFPCFDEPAMKAEFTFTLTRHKNFTSVLFNTPRISSTPEGDWVVDKFKKTVKMSTYLVAYVISNFESIDMKSGKGVLIEVAGRPEAIKGGEGDFGLKESADIIDFFSVYFGVDYPLEKSTQVGIPDFNSGAMENWGLVTYRESSLFYNEKSDTIENKIRVAKVIAHELAHQWYGNLVTMEWWNDLWLNEGFASWVENLGLNRTHPEWRHLDYFFINRLQTVLNLDSLESSHAISVEVNNPNNIKSIFDTISYSKGASVIRMMNAFLGESTFRKGVSKYLNDYQFSNTRQDDLWNTLNVAATEDKVLENGLTVKDIMDSWTLQKGYPVVHMIRSGNTLNASQDWFLVNSDNKVEGTDEYFNAKWFVPITYTTKTEKDFKFEKKPIWLKKDMNELSIDVTHVPANDWIIGNVKYAGFYRVNYDESNWKLLIAQLKENYKLIDPTNRAGLLDDSFNLGRSTLVEQTLYLDITKYLQKEQDPLPLRAVFKGLEYINSMLELDSEALPLLNQYYRNILLETYNRLGWRTDLQDANEISLQTTVLRVMCRSGYQPCVNQAHKFYSQFITNQIAIPSDFKSTVYYTVIEQGSDAVWQDFYQRTLAENSPAEKLRMLRALAKSKNLITLKFFLDKTSDPTVVKKQDEASIVTSIASNVYGQQMVFDYMDEKWDSLLEQYGDVSFTLPNIVSSVTSNLNSDFDVEKLNRFLANHPYTGIAEPAFNNALETVGTNNKWVKRNKDSIKKWLNDNVKPDPVTTTIAPTTVADLTTVVETTTTTTPEKVNVRLPEDLVPTLYELEIRPYIGPAEVYGDRAFTFDGKIAMTMNCVKATSKIVFHGLNLDITVSGLELYSTVDKAAVPFSSVLDYDLKREYYTMTVNEQLKAGKEYTLVVPYKADIVDRLDGFYRQQYVEKGKTFHLASTHFEPTDARRAFPCFDEPALKAEWQLTVIRHNTFSESLFNTPLISSEPYAQDKDWIVDRFEKSVKMSTYLVAFVVSNLEKITQQSPRFNVTIEVYARPEAIQAKEGDFGLKEAAEIIDYFSEYFNVPYPLKKSTQVAVPNFGAGAMENWGLVIYREASLLYNAITDTIANKRRVSLVVAHELAHQWYGNLVTMEWWTDLWLNEGFASWVENLGLNKAHPEWRDLDYFYTSRISVMETDSLESSHPVSVEVNDPGEIGAIFDAISYDKGASVIRMMNGFLSEPTFRKGVSSYLDVFKYKNTVQDDLFDQLNKAAVEDKSLDSSITVKEIMDTWTLQKGYPVVDMKRDGNILKSSQKWFLLNPDNTLEGTEEYEKMKWYVPITYTTKSEKDFNFEKKPVWLKPDMAELPIDVRAVPADEWIVGNVKHAGFYRVNYDENNWKLLIAQLNEDHKQIDATSRAALLDDSFNLGRAGKLSQTVYLDIASYLKREEDPLAYLVSFSGMGYIYNMFEAEKETSELMNKFYIKLMLNVYNKFGWRTDLVDANEIKLQLSVLSTMCRSGYQPCINRANEYYHDFADFNEPIPADFKTTVFNTFVESGDEDDWEDLYERALTTTNAAEKLRMLRSLTKSKNAYVLKDYLNKALDEDIVKKQDQIYIIGDIASNVYGRRFAFDFMDEKWDYLASTFGGLSSLSRLVTSVTRKLNTKKGLEDIKEFIEKHPEGTTTGIATAAFKEAIETVTSNVRWMKDNKESVVSWLRTYLNPPPQPALNYRLPQDLAPSTYRLSIKPYFTSTTKPEKYDGQVEIDFECLKNTKQFVIHYNKLDLNYSTLEITSETDADFKTTPANPKHTYSPITHFFALEFPGGQQFKAGSKYTFKVDFVGYTKEDNLGFYASKYQDNGEKWIVSSQLETVEARKSFPCFDEPAMKAKFNLKLIHDSSLTAFSNMPIKQKQVTPGEETTETISVSTVGDTTEYTTVAVSTWVETEFEETPIMSTYLLAILLADYSCIEDTVKSKSGRDILSKVCTRKNALDELALARNASIGALEALESLYDVPYPLPKLDHVSSPTFNFGAMENWGLAIYLERLFLKNENSTQSTEQRIVTIITHEIAHMWFGNLVTPKWWNDLWLNEGFARYMQFVGANELRPEWELLEQHANMLLDVLNADAGNSVRALSQDANTPEEINAMVDPTITYGKGSGVVRMLNYVLGSESFYQALTAYFEKHKYTNVDQFDLWRAMADKGKANNVQNLGQIDDLASVMSVWTKQAGHPVVTVTLDDVKDQLVVTQKQFKRDPLAKQGDFKWTIPFTYSIESNVFLDKPTEMDSMNISTIKDSIDWIKPTEEVTTIDLNASPTQDNFVLANIEMTGYYRVNYDPENWAKIIKQLEKDKKIPPIMKAQLINDAFALSQSTDVEADLPLKIVRTLSQNTLDTEYLPWSAFLSRYGYYADMFYASRIGSDLKEKMAGVIAPLFNFYQAADDSSLTWNQRLIKSQVFSLACSHEVKECTSSATTKFSEAMANNNIEEIDSEIRQTFACTAIRHGTKAEFDYLFNLIDTNSGQLLDLISASLACTRDRALLEKFLYKSEEFSASKQVQAIRNAIAYSGGDDLVWNYVKTKWDSLVAGNKVSTLNSLLEKITSKFNNKYQKDDFEHFFEIRPNMELAADIEVIKQKINTNRYWYNRSLETVQKWLVGLRQSE